MKCLEPQYMLGLRVMSKKGLDAYGVTEYFKANSETQIRKEYLSEDEKERLIKEVSNRILQGEVRVLGTLAHLGILEE